MSKTLFITVFLSTLLSFFNSRAKDWNYTYFVSGDSLINPGNSINILLSAASWSDCQPSGNCFLSDFQWFKNGIPLMGKTNYIFTASDTGVYRVDFISDCLGLRSKSFHLAYRQVFSQANESSAEKISPYLYPAGSSIYRINMTGKKMKQLILSENSGRLVLTLLNGASEINLENFAPGIYYYTIYDEDKNAWRGKILKE